jgi:hypothetical protein
MLVATAKDAGVIDLSGINRDHGYTGDVVDVPDQAVIAIGTLLAWRGTAPNCSLQSSTVTPFTNFSRGIDRLLRGSSSDSDLESSLALSKATRSRLARLRLHSASMGTLARMLLCAGVCPVREFPQLLTADARAIWSTFCDRVHRMMLKMCEHVRPEQPGAQTLESLLRTRSELAHFGRWESLEKASAELAARLRAIYARSSHEKRMRALLRAALAQPAGRKLDLKLVQRTMSSQASVQVDDAELAWLIKNLVDEQLAEINDAGDVTLTRLEYADWRVLVDLRSSLDEAAVRRVLGSQEMLENTLASLRSIHDRMAEISRTSIADFVDFDIQFHQALYAPLSSVVGLTNALLRKLFIAVSTPNVGMLTNAVLREHERILSALELALRTLSPQANHDPDALPPGAARENVLEALSYHYKEAGERILKGDFVAVDDPQRALIFV